MKRLLIISAVLMLSACVKSTHFGLISTKEFDINSPSLTIGGESDYSDVIKEPGTLESKIKRVLAQNKCAVALSNVTITYYANPFVSPNMVAQEVLDKSLPGCGDKNKVNVRKQAMRRK